MAFNSTRSRLNRCVLRWPFFFPTSNAINVSTVICAVKALVEATPISGPACVYDPLSVSRDMLDPTTLQTPNTWAPCSFASRMAAKVSAVSPDCEMAMTTSSGRMMGFLYRNSEAYSTSTGMRAKSSKRYSATRPACQLVPHAMMRMRCAFSQRSQCSSMPDILISER